MKNLNKRQEFIRLRGMGESYSSISKEIGISKQTLLKWSEKYAHELSQAKLKVLDNIIEEYDIAKSGRLKIIAKDMLRLDAELSKRDFSSISTFKLMGIKLKALEVAGNILDAKRVEVGGSLQIDDTMSRWNAILNQCVKPVEIEE
jgi:orotate phosphoribosyltransferase-like protein